MRAKIMTMRLKYVLLVRNISRDCPSDVADGDGECAFPRSAGGSWIPPAGFEGIFSAGDGGVGAIRVFGDSVGIEGGADDVLDGRCQCYLGTSNMKTDDPTAMVTPAKSP